MESCNMPDKSGVQRHVLILQFHSYGLGFIRTARGGFHIKAGGGAAAGLIYI